MENIKEGVHTMIGYCRLGKEALDRYSIISKVTGQSVFINEFDILRSEIGRCYVTESFHACITLTNHLLERYCKYFLIMHDSGFKTIKGNLETLSVIFEKPIKKYINKDLNDNLAALKKLGFISKKYWKRLDGYRKQFRNGFGHGDSDEILLDAKGGFVSGNFNTMEMSEPIELQYSQIPLFWGLAIEGFVKKYALLYYAEVENLIRRTVSHIQPDDFVIAYPLLVITRSKK